jgi:rubrerythrin
MIVEQDAKEVFQNLKRLEEDHKTILWKMFKEVSGKAPPSEFPEYPKSPENQGDDVMEGGMLVISIEA